MAKEDIRQRLLDNTGIDFAAYQHEEFVEALDVTSSIIDSIRRAVIWSVGAEALAALVIWMTWRGGGGVLAVIALTLIALVGVISLGAAIWIRSLGAGLEAQTRDLLRVAGESTDRMQTDLSRADPAPTDRQLAEGLLLVTVVPAFGAAVRRRVWLIGRPLAALSERVMTIVLGRATAELEDRSATGPLVGNLAMRLDTLISVLTTIAEPILNRFRRWVVQPLTIGLLLVAILAGVALIALAVVVSN